MYSDQIIERVKQVNVKIVSQFLRTKYHCQGIKEFVFLEKKSVRVSDASFEKCPLQKCPFIRKIRKAH